MEREALILRGLFGAVSLVCLLVLATMLWLAVAAPVPRVSRLAAGGHPPTTCVANTPHDTCVTARS